MAVKIIYVLKKIYRQTFAIAPLATARLPGLTNLVLPSFSAFKFGL